MIVFAEVLQKNIVFGIWSFSIVPTVVDDVPTDTFEFAGRVKFDILRKK